MVQELHCVDFFVPLEMNNKVELEPGQEKHLNESRRRKLFLKLSSCRLKRVCCVCGVFRDLRGVCCVWVHTFVVIIVVIHTIESGGWGEVREGFWGVEGPDVTVSPAAVLRLVSPPTSERPAGIRTRWGFWQ